MATITGLTAAQMLLLADDNINGGTVNNLGNLVLTTRGGKSIDAGPIIAAGTSGQYYRGDKTWQNLNKAAVGLDQVENVAGSTIYLPKWQPNTAYALGQQVVLPTNDVATPIAAFTSGATFDITKWLILTSSPKALVAQIRNAVTSGAIGTTQTVVENFPTYTFIAGRRYRIEWIFEYTGSTAGDYGTYDINTTNVGATPSSTAGLTKIGGSSLKILDANVGHHGESKASFSVTSTTALQIKFTANIWRGTGTTTLQSSSINNITYSIYDDGSPNPLISK